MPMPIATLLETSVPRKLIAWTDRFARPEWRGCVLEGWLFEGPAARRGTEERLREAGVHARLRSAYKPLLHFFLEEVDREQLVAATVRYPVHPRALPRRFLLEAYPLAALLGDTRLEFIPAGPDLHYEVALTLRDGSTRTERVFAPNREHDGPNGSLQLSPTGWLRVRRASGEAPVIDEREESMYEALFARAIGAIRAHPWPAQEPFFDRLDIRVDLPGVDEPLPVGHEAVSTLEALHEDLYFSALEVFQERSGRGPGDRRLQPGQIVPDVRATGAAPRVLITVRRFAPIEAEAPAVDGPPLESLDAAPPSSRVASELALMPGRRFAATSRQGRAVEGVWHDGEGAPVFISGGQHANETSGVVGALRAAHALQARRAAFAVLPLENPDGYALQRELAALQPRHMLHAARYTALGDDVEYRDQPPLYERGARQEAFSLSGAQLHVNLHGYPAHEWTRPLSGYLPQGFEAWTIPKGFFLILRHHAGWDAEARALMEQVSAEVAQVPRLAEYNARQIALYERHAGPVPFEVLHGVACSLSQVDRPGAPVTLITEFPDETVTGDDFRFAHQVQMEAALAARRAWQALARR
jgi:hypothetical protein